MYGAIPRSGAGLRPGLDRQGKARKAIQTVASMVTVCTRRRFVWTEKLRAAGASRAFQAAFLSLEPGHDVGAAAGLDMRPLMRLQFVAPPRAPVFLDHEHRPGRGAAPVPRGDLDREAVTGGAI